MAKDLRAFAIGLLVFVGISLAYLALATRSNEPSGLPQGVAFVVIYSAPLLSGFVCGLLSGKRPWGTLLALAVVAAASFIALDFASTKLASHRLELSGLSAIDWIAGVSLLIMPLLVMVGGVFGIGLRKPDSESMQKGDPKLKVESDGDGGSR